MPEPKSTTIEISTVSILKLFLVVLALLFLYVIRDIVAILFVSIIFAAAILPAVEWFERWHMPRWVGILIVYLAALAVVSAAVALLIPALTVQVSELAINFPQVYNRFLDTFSGFRQPLEANFGEGIHTLLQDWGNQLADATGDIVNTVTRIVGGVIMFFGILVLTFYMLLEDDGLSRVVQSLAPRTYHAYVMRLLTAMQDRISLWLRGQLILMLAVGVLVLIGLEVLGVKFALVLALIAAITELIPYLGPIAGAIPGIFIAFTQSPLLGLLTLILYIVVQQLENHVLVPRVMSKTVGLNPIVIIVAILVGAKVAGIIGAIVAIPVATALAVLLREVFDSNRQLDA